MIAALKQLFAGTEPTEPAPAVPEPPFDCDITAALRRASEVEAQVGQLEDSLAQARATVAGEEQRQAELMAAGQPRDRAALDASRDAVDRLAAELELARRAHGLAVRRVDAVRNEGIPALVDWGYENMLAWADELATLREQLVAMRGRANATLSEARARRVALQAATVGGLAALDVEGPLRYAQAALGELVGHIDRTHRAVDALRRRPTREDAPEPTPTSIAPPEPQPASFEIVRPSILQRARDTGEPLDAIISW